MAAPEQLIQWLANYAFVDRRGRLPAGMRLQYHSRSDEHSRRLGELIVLDLLDNCPVLALQAADGLVAYGINVPFRWPNGKQKTLDLVVGVPSQPLQPPANDRIDRLSGRKPTQAFERLLMACEEKAVMTEHGKSQPRIYSELNDAHTIVHQGSRDTIAAGITMVNVATTFVSPLRQRPGTEIVVTRHRQPEVAQRMVTHLRGLPTRSNSDSVGLDAYCTFVVDVDNQGHAELHTAPPSPQPGDPDHFQTFLELICHFYTERYSDLAHLWPARGQSVEEALTRLANDYPGLLRKAGELIAATKMDGGTELQALLGSLGNLSSDE